MFKKYGKQIMAISIPIMLSNLISQLQMLIDRMFLGKLDLTCMSAVGNASSPMWTTMSALFALTMGSTILVSQACGADDKERARAITASMYKYNNVLGFVLFLFWVFCPQVAFRLMGVDESIIGMSITYARIYSPVFLMTGLGAAIISMLQVSKKTTIMVAYGLVRSILNIILDYLLIFGHFGFKAMGVAGASLATTIAEFIGSMVVFIYVLRDDSLWLKPTLKEVFGAGRKVYIESIKLGAPSACEDFAWNLGSLYLLAMLNHVSVEAAGIHSIIFGIELVAIVIVGAVGSATLTLAGYETGGGNKQGVWDVSVVSILICLGVSLLNLIAFMLCPEMILGIFTTDQGVIQAAPLYLLIVGIDLFPKAGNIIFGSAIKGYGNPGWMLMTQIFGTIFVVVISTILVLVLHLGMIPLFILVVVDESLRCVLNFFKLRKIRRS